MTQIDVFPIGQKDNRGISSTALDGPLEAANMRHKAITVIKGTFLRRDRCPDQMEPQNSIDHSDTVWIEPRSKAMPRSSQMAIIVGSWNPRPVQCLMDRIE
ncbi:MAG: hypothetical protein LQ348_001833 [Seirophora lacunosa]|nr:MAG: hypothetical protein LQ348_001833 [Seirophora lacunosa]